MNRGQYNDVWNKQKTEFTWRSNKYQDNPTGTGGEWGLFQNFWLDSWKIVQSFITMSGRMFIRTSNDGSRWNPSRWKEVLFKQDMEQYSWQLLTLQNGWQHHRDYNNVQYSKSLDGVVYLRGVMTKGSASYETVIAQLPVGFRPLHSTYVFAMNDEFSVASLCILTSGEIVVRKNVDNRWLSLDNISFRI